MKSVFVLSNDGPKDDTSYGTPYDRAYTLCERKCKTVAFESLEDAFDYAVGIFEHVKTDLEGWVLLKPITMSMYDTYTYFVYAEYRNELLDEESKEIVSFMISRYVI